MNAAVPCPLNNQTSQAKLLRSKTPSNLLVCLHGIWQITPLFLYVRNKLINYPRPGTILTPETQGFILHRLLEEFEGLIPHILVNCLRPVCFQKLDPEVGPVCCFSDPWLSWFAEDHLPIHEGILKRKGFLAWFS